MNVIEELRKLPPARAQEFVASLPADQKGALLSKLFNWRETWARPEQIAPDGDWNIWLVKAGRGYGKTRIGSEFTREEVKQGRAKRIALVGRTAADVRDTMVEGESGILATSPPWFRPVYEPSKRRITWPNGSIATCFAAKEPDQLRGPQHDCFWADEVAAWEYPEAWDQLMFGLRLGLHPRGVATTTPRPVRVIRDLMKDPTCVVTSGSSYENKKNLADTFFNQIIGRYEGSSKGRQEIWAELLEEADGALWKRGWIDRSRLEHLPEVLDRVVVAIDPAVTDNDESDETGLVVGAIADCFCREDGKVEQHGFIFRDDSSHFSPDEWASHAISLYDEFSADRVVAETNNGGDLVEATLRTKDKKKRVAYRKVHASRGKRTRAEPVAALYEQGRIHHVGVFADMEDQMCNWEANSGSKSPDRLDAAVWCIYELMLKGGDQVRAWSDNPTSHKSAWRH